MKHQNNSSMQVISSNSLVQNNFLPKDFVSLEQIDFYGKYGPAQPDRVYVNENGEIVAFFWRENCTSIQNHLKMAAKRFYEDNRALLYMRGFFIDEEIECDDEDGLSSGDICSCYVKTYFKSLWSAAGIYGLITLILRKGTEDGEKKDTNMTKRVVACVMNNLIVKSSRDQDKWYRKDKNTAYLGIEVGFGNHTEISKPKHIIIDKAVESIIESDSEIELDSLPKILFMLRYIEDTYRRGTIHNNNGEKNYASYWLTKVNSIFVDNYERQMRFLNISQDDIPLQELQNFANVLVIRRYINNIVLSYRWMTINLNLFNSGDLTYLNIASLSNYNRYYLASPDVITLANNISLRVSTEINRYLNRCDIDLATTEFLKEALERNSIQIETLSEKEQELENQLEELGHEFINQTSENIKEFHSKLNQSFDIPKIFDDSDKFIETCYTFQKIQKTNQQLETIKRDLKYNMKFKELIIFHCQLQFIQKYFPDFSAIIIHEESSFLTHKYDIEFLR